MSAAANYWLPVDQYIGGIEHAILHLLYARFFHKVMRDQGLVDCDEPFTKHYCCQGMVLKDGAKMSKSKGNTVDPQELIERYGADTVRHYMMSTAPPEQALEWNDAAVAGSHRFLQRLWDYASRHAEGVRGAAKTDRPSGPRDARRELHEALQQGLRDFEREQFNTVVSAGNKMLNTLRSLDNDADRAESADGLRREGLQLLLQLLAPIIPHLCHTLWRELGFGDDVLDAGWPQVDPAALERASITLAVQVNGKLRAQIEVEADAERDAIQQVALTEDNVRRHVDNRPLRKVIVVPR